MLARVKVKSDSPNLNCILGLFGDGKTATAMDMMLRHWARGGVVATNINVQANPYVSTKFGPQAGFIWALKTLYNWDFKEGQLIRLSDEEQIEIISSRGKPIMVPRTARFWEDVPKGKHDLRIMVFIDEAHKTWGKNGYLYMPQEDTDIISIMRHLNIELYIMSQAWEHVWTDLRRLTQCFYRVNNLKNGGMGVVASLPPVLKLVISIPMEIIGFLLSPLLAYFPDYIRIRKFRGEKEDKKFIYKGYPKFKRFSTLVLGSYDSPEHVHSVDLAEDVPNDFRDLGKAAELPKSVLVKKWGGVVLGVALILFAFVKTVLADKVSSPAVEKRRSGVFGNLLGSSSDSSSAGLAKSVLFKPLVSPVPVFPSIPVFLYRSYSEQSHGQVYRLCLIDSSGVRYFPGDLFAGKTINCLVRGRLYFDDGTYAHLVRHVAPVEPL